MNELQRQLLSDRLNEVGQSIDRYKKAITKLDHQLLVKNIRLNELYDEEKKLMDGVDW